MKQYDAKRFVRLLRLYSPDVWDREDEQRPPFERLSPYVVRSDGVYRLPITRTVCGLEPAELDALHDGPLVGSDDKLLPLPATLPQIVHFLDTTGEYVRLPGRNWPRLQRLVNPAPAGPDRTGGQAHHLQANRKHTTPLLDILNAAIEKFCYSENYPKKTTRIVEDFILQKMKEQGLPPSRHIAQIMETLMAPRKYAHHRQRKQTKRMIKP